MITINEGSVNNANAGAKAKDDVIKISKQMDYNQLIISNPPSHLAKLNYLIKSYTGGLKAKYQLKSQLIIFQYAGYFNFTTDVTLRVLKKYNPNAQIYLFIHDVAYLRHHLAKDWRREAKLFNAVDGLIVHNHVMQQWLQTHGIKSHIVVLNIFDYLTDYQPQKHAFNKKIVFAGNLGKSTFLTKLKINTPVELFGPNPAKNYQANIHYRRIKKPDELARFLDQSFGLVWDGNSTVGCSGDLGNYERYNNPHKVSLYLSAGLPVIIWKKAALAHFIKKHRLGIAVDNLNDLDQLISQISPAAYTQMQQNVAQMASKLRNGVNTTQALKKVESFVNN